MTHESLRWILASSNAGKLAEYRNLLAGTPVQLEALNVSGPEETGLTFVENALIKARHAAMTTGQPAIAEDSGLCVDALGGAPGVRSARYAGDHATDEDNRQKLLRALDGCPDEARQAAFHCVIVALRQADDPAPVVATGRWIGAIARAPRGSSGFGYDPVFVVPGPGLTAAELSPEAKNAISHRYLASIELRRQLGW